MLSFSLHTSFSHPVACAVEPSSLSVNHLQSDTAHMCLQEVSCCVCLTFELSHRMPLCANAMNKSRLEYTINQKGASSILYS